MTEHIVDLEELRLRRPGFELGPISLAIPRGHIVGLVGPNGAGKTTIIRSLLGLVAGTAERIEVAGHEPGSTASLARIGVVLDQPTAAPEWRVRSIPSRLAPFYPAWDDARFGELLDRLAVPADRKVGELSRGQGIKLSLASALAHEPELLILDEPSSGLDPAARREIADVLREFALDGRRSVLLSTHITTDLDGLADELLVLIRGRIAHRGILPDVVEEFAIARGTGSPDPGPLIGVQQLGAHWTALVRSRDTAEFGPEVVIDPATVDDIVIHLGADAMEVAA